MLQRKGKWCHRGLSPRVRGSLVQPGARSNLRGSIPARAGEPLSAGTLNNAPQVYPRACGGATIRITARERAEGLSPRVRGSRSGSRRSWVCRRSIPARAGEPLPRPLHRRRPRVYPRACGGAESRYADASYSSGLSPRVRGSPLPVLIAVCSRRSIPARAGEPGMRWKGSAGCGVYPRACGGARLRHEGPSIRAGLSPRVRGSRRPSASSGSCPRSIPARAGEPPKPYPDRALPRVYPRACGGARPSSPPCPLAWGLSPRVRGSLVVRPSHKRRPGSIPARAGEPARESSRRERMGSIPARAGEPYPTRPVGKT